MPLATVINGGECFFVGRKKLGPQGVGESPVRFVQILCKWCF